MESIQEVETTTDKKKISFTLSTFIVYTFAIVSFTFTVTTIYNTFLRHDDAIVDNKEFVVKALSEIKTYFEEKDEKTNGRVNKITGRIITRVEELEKDNSDSGK